jgi:hypothetical protein
MPDGIDQETLDRAYLRLAEYHNEDLPEGIPETSPETFAGYTVTPYEDWLIFNSADSYTNQTFLVSDQMVYESPGWQSYEDALAEATELKAAGATRRPEEPDDEDDDEDDEDEDDD